MSRLSTNAVLGIPHRVDGHAGKPGYVVDVAQLVLQFREYRGATLFQVAQSDPDYLRWLGLTAQRPQVRAAAMQLVRALEVSQQALGGRRTPKSNSRHHDG